MKDTKISWCDHTFNPWIGCTKVSPGCANCYAETMMDKRWGKVKWGAGNPRQRTSAANWKQPLKWNREASPEGRGIYYAQHGAYLPDHRPRVFCGSLCDWLDDEVPIEWLANLLDLIQRTPNLDWLLLSKRPQNWKPRMAALQHVEPLAWDWFAMGRTPANVWIGTTVEDQKRADERIPLLLSIPAKVRFLSCEPLLGPVNFGDYRHSSQGKWKMDGFHWCICGGESGPNARPMHPGWARSLRNQCQDSDTPYFFKQRGAWWDTNLSRIGDNFHDILDGKQHHEFPQTPAEWHRAESTPNASPSPPGNG